MGRDLKKEITKRERVERDLRMYNLNWEHIKFCFLNNYLNEMGIQDYRKYEKIDNYLKNLANNNSVMSNKKLDYITRYLFSCNNYVFLNQNEYCLDMEYTDRTLYNITKAITEDLYTILYELD